ncbi:hypothetical protein Btru_000761 [Bulinus truncatus]|nr:hypothetical protein Btru_000761 [Bulinus truncatus]
MKDHLCAWHFLVILMNGVLSPVQNAVVKMDPVIPFVGKMYYIRCVLETEIVDLEALHQTPFRFQLRNKICEVRSWLKCEYRQRRMTDGDCFCSHKYIQDGLLLYNFLYFIQSFPRNVVNLTSCGLEYYASDKREVETVDFAMSPGQSIRNCSGGEMRLNWVYHPLSDSIREAMIPKKVEWFFQNRPLADYRVSNKVFTSHVSQCCSLVKTGLIPLLKLRKLTNMSSGVYSINVIFHQLRTSKDQEDVSNVYEDNEPSSVRIKRNGQVVPQYDIHEASEPGDESDPNLSPLSEDTTTLPPYPEIQNTLTGTTRLTVSYPPDKDVYFQMKGFHTLSGTMVVRCSVYNIQFFGRPEVNLTVWQMSQLVASKSAAYSLVYSAPTGRGVTFNFSCGFSGEALQCLQPKDPRLKRVYLHDYENEKSPNTIVSDVMKIIFGLQTVLCLGLTLWTTSLLIQHVKLFIRVVNQRNQRLVEAPRTMGRHIMGSRVKFVMGDSWDKTEEGSEMEESSVDEDYSRAGDASFSQR